MTATAWLIVAVAVIAAAGYAAIWIINRAIDRWLGNRRDGGGSW